MIYKKILPKFLLFVFGIAILFSSCDTAESNDPTLSLSMSVNTSLPKITDDTINLDSVKILLRDIKIKKQSGNDSLNVKVGPFVVYLNLAGMTTDFAVSNIDPGSYDRIRFRVHKLEDSETPPDPEFKDSTDSSLRYSVIVKGTFNSVPFIYKSRKSAHQDIKLDTPIVVEENSSANLTITVDPLNWFVENGVVLNPNDSSNVNDIDNNIKDSFNKAFRDNNYDGIGD